MDSFLVILEQLVAFFLMMLIGYVAAKKKVTTREFLDRLATLIMKLLLPIMIFANMMNGTSRDQLAGDLPALFMVLGIYLSLIVIFKILALPAADVVGEPGTWRYLQRVGKHC